MEEVDWLPSTQSGGNQNALFQAARRAGDGARDFDRQVAELQVRAAILNRFTRLGTPTTVDMA
jgi:hypothetical protein